VRERGATEEQRMGNLPWVSGEDDIARDGPANREPKAGAPEDEEDEVHLPVGPMLFHLEDDEELRVGRIKEEKRRKKGFDKRKEKN